MASIDRVTALVVDVRHDLDEFEAFARHVIQQRLDWNVGAGTGYVDVFHSSCGHLNLRPARREGVYQLIGRVATIMRHSRQVRVEPP